MCCDWSNLRFGIISTAPDCRELVYFFAFTGGGKDGQFSFFIFRDLLPNILLPEKKQDF